VLFDTYPRNKIYGRLINGILNCFVILEPNIFKYNLKSMFMLRLTEKEMLVLYSLVRWPSLNDIELSNKIPVKRPTITAIRNKLKKEDFYYDILAPNLSMLGCEVLTVRYGSFNPTAKYEARKKYSTLDKFPEVFFKQSCDSQRVAMSAATNFTETMKYVEYSNITYSKYDLFSEEGIRHAFFPLKLSRIVRFFDYAPLLKKEFKITLKEDKHAVDFSHKEVQGKDLTENEKLVLYALVKYPELNDKEIAKKVSMTRQSINKMRKKFEGDELVKRIRIPNMKKLGYEVMSLIHFFIKPRYTMDERKEGVKYVLTYPEVIFLLISNLESVVLGVSRTFTELRKDYNTFLGEYKKSDFMARDPVVIEIPIDEIKESVIGRYHPLVRKILQIKKEI